MCSPPLCVSSYSDYRNLLGQIVLTLLALIVSSVVVRRFDTCVYTAATALYSLGFVADVWRVIEW